MKGISTAPLRDRLRSFLEFVRPKLLVRGTDQDRLSKLRQVSDVRIRKLSIGTPHITALDLCEALSDPANGTFDGVAVQEGLFPSPYLALPLESLSEEMGYMIEVCLYHQVAGKSTMQECTREYVKRHGTLEPPKGTTGAFFAPPKPLPPEVERLLGTIQGLWSLPLETRKIIDTLSLPTPRIDLVCAVLERDPALSRRALLLANVSGYVSNLRVQSVGEMASTLGPRPLRWIVPLASLLGYLGSPPAQAWFDPALFWNHNLWVANAASLVARAARFNEPGDYFAAGFVHDLGKLVIARYFPKGMQKLAEASGGEESAAQVERRLLGVNHGVIGGCVCTRWGFPPRIAVAAQHHMTPVGELEDVELSLEGMIVNVLCAISRGALPPGELETGNRLLQVPATRLAEILTQASTLADGTLKEILRFN